MVYTIYTFNHFFQKPKYGDATVCQHLSVRAPKGFEIWPAGVAVPARQLWSNVF